MKIFLTNSLKQKKEEFTPINPQDIRMYVCGPTVYDRPHLGNARSAVAFDVLYRVLKAVYPKVSYVRNITDVDDKIINAVKGTDEKIYDLTKRITGYYHEDLEALKCLRPTAEPRATEYIAQMIAIIQDLIKLGHAYEVEGHVLFSVQSYKDYGHLSHRSRDEMIAGARVEVAPYKKDPADFVLWKPSPDDEYDYGFDSPWGRGRPGWHIECSAMSRDLLGEHFDIHCGGADLMFPHHENEVAQSVCSSHNHTFVNYWVHNGFLMVEGEKMSKSLGNFTTVREALDKGIEGVTLRYFYLSTHYRKPIDFTQKAIEDAHKSVEKFRHALSHLSSSGAAVSRLETRGSIEPMPQALHMEFLQILCDDLNTPEVLAKLHAYATEANKGDAIAAQKLKAGAEFLGLDLSVIEKAIPEAIVKLAEDRKKAKLAKNWALADSLRKEIESKGYLVRDRDAGEYDLVER